MSVLPSFVFVTLGENPLIPLIVADASLATSTPSGMSNVKANPASTLP